ncbi:MAG TPA: carotenoid oxygenase family protein, partial [Acidimicrobiales bacterium]|nr:carotenoid oxygenase family protein [Acidimicrobiales bacterium]
MTTTSHTPAAASEQALSGNRYLAGVFAPVDTELTTFDLPVEGEIPAAVDGLLVRNGPNPIAADPDSYHWFTGNGMLHGIELSAGRAKSYRNRWVRTDAVA